MDLKPQKTQIHRRYIVQVNASMTCIRFAGLRFNLVILSEASKIFLYLYRIKSSRLINSLERSSNNDQDPLASEKLRLLTALARININYSMGGLFFLPL